MDEVSDKKKKVTSGNCVKYCSILLSTIKKDICIYITDSSSSFEKKKLLTRLTFFHSFSIFEFEFEFLRVLVDIIQKLI